MTITQTRRPDWKLWTSRILQTLIALFLLFDAAAKLFRLAPVVQANMRIGYPDASIVPLGGVLFVFVVLYVVPRTAVLGAALLTAWLGGATATHVRIGDPFWMPIVFGVIVWGCLYLRDERIRALLPVVAPRR